MCASVTIYGNFLRLIKYSNFLDYSYSIEKTINIMRPCYVNLETEAKVESLKKEVACGEDREQDVASSPSMNNACDDDYDYYPEDNYDEEPGNPEPSPAKIRKVEPLGEN